MKDGTELTHYGVKGMKWGKRLFGKVKGVFGKPGTYDRENDKYRIAKFTKARDQKIDAANAAYNQGRISAANLSNRIGQAHDVREVQAMRKFSQMAKKEGLSGTDQTNEANRYANRVKRHSKKINGR